MRTDKIVTTTTTCVRFAEGSGEQTMGNHQAALLAAAVSLSGAPAGEKTEACIIARANVLYRYINGGIPRDAYTPQEVKDALGD